MTLIGVRPRSYNDFPPPDVFQQVSPRPVASAEINAAITQSAQEFPPATNLGPWYGLFYRTDWLPPIGTKDRDWALRILLYNENNNLAQAVVSALIKRISTIPTRVNGDRKKLIYLPNTQGMLRSISAVEHYETVIAEAQFGAGWPDFISRWVQDFLTQDYGGFVELIGPGDPIGPIRGPVTAIAHIDAGRCYMTGNPYYPVLYYSLYSGALHRMHTSRIIRMADMPSPDERYFGIGLCALSRTAAVARREQFMNRYIEGLVDDKPPPGILLAQGFTEVQRNRAMTMYEREQSSNQRPVWGKNAWFFSLDADKPIKMEHFPFSTTPEKFNWVQYTELDVHALAAGFNIDVQEIWELTGRQGLGSTAQSQVLHTKSEAKMIGWLNINIKRYFNRRVFGDSGCTLDLDYNDPIQQENEATIDGQLMTTAINGAKENVLTSQEARVYLSSNSQRLRDALQQTPGQEIGPDAAESVTPQRAVVGDVPTPVDQGDLMKKQAEKPAPAPFGGGQQGSDKTPPAGAVSQPRKQRKGYKIYGITTSEFERLFRRLTYRALDGKYDKDAFENALLDQLALSTVKAYKDGLRAGGNTDPFDADARADIQNYLVSQIDYISGLADQLDADQVAPEDVHNKAVMWRNKSIQNMYYKGLYASGANPAMEWQLGATEEHCPDCASFAGQVKSFRDWYDDGWLPKSSQLACKGFNCDCQLIHTDKVVKSILAEEVAA